MLSRLPKTNIIYIMLYFVKVNVDVARHSS